VRVPRGTGEEILRKLQSGEAALPAVTVSMNHRVKRGETLTRIANQYGVSPQALARANHITQKNPLRRGMVLSIPSSLKTTKPQPVSADFVGPLPPSSVVPTRTLVVPALRLPATSANSEETLLDRSRPYRTIRVRRGESIGSIARREGVTVSQLMRWNGLKHPAVRKSQRLRIQLPDAAPAESATEPAAMVVDADAASPTAAGVAGNEPASLDASDRAPTIVRVRPGDTLSGLARQHGTTVDALRKANRLKSGQTLKAGQRLVIPQS
jgi:membrane-bound lytic murein transglycosylase D